MQRVCIENRATRGRVRHTKHSFNLHPVRQQKKTKITHMIVIIHTWDNKNRVNLSETNKILSSMMRQKKVATKNHGKKKTEWDT